MLRMALRSLAGRKLRLLATGIAVTLGVAFMAGTLVLTDTIGRTFDNLFSDVYEGTDAVVRAEAAFDNPDGFGDERGRVDAALLDVVRSVDGVAAAEPSLFGYAQLVDTEGEPVGNPAIGPPVAGGNWIENDALNVYTVAEGRPPQTDREVIVDVRSARRGGYDVGDTATVLVKGGPIEVTIVGVMRFGDADSPAGASFTLFTTEAAQELVGEPGRLDEIVVVAAEGVSQEQVTERIAGSLPDGVEALTGAAITAEYQDLMADGMGFFNTFLMVFAVIALLVGGFMIFNSFSITVAQRTRENALLRAVGASRRQVLVSVAVEALVVGVVASLIGLVAGFLVATLLQGLLAAVGFDLPTTGLVFTLTTGLVAFSAGVIVTLAAAVSPARKASKIAPVAAMRDTAVGSTGYGSKERVAVGTVILLGGLGALLYGLFGETGNALAVVGLGALLVFFGVSVLGRTVSLPLSRVLGWPLPKVRGIAGSLARENAMRNPKRTAATASALMIGVGLVAFITIFAASAKASFSATIDKAFTGDFVLTHSSAAGFGTGGLDPSVTAAVNDLPEVDVAAGIRFGAAMIDGSPDYLIAADLPTFDLVDVEPLQGTPTDLDATTIAVHETTAEDKDLAIGDTVPVVFRETGPQVMTVAMIYGEDQPAGRWVLGLPAYEANFAEQFDSQVFVRRAEGVEPDVALAAIEEATAVYPGVKVLDQTEYKADQMAMIDQMLGLVYALLGLAILIALLGIGNTLGLSILERVRELGVLRAVGMTRSQLRSVIRWESVIIALQGTALGLLIGSFFGWALVVALADEGFRVFAYPAANLAVVVVLAALAGVLAAVLPARRAARLDVLRSISAE
jgi:putative ABC transport system permease protein